MTQHGHARLRRLGVLLAIPAVSALALAGCGGGGDDDGGSGGAANSFTFSFGSATGQESPWATLAEKYTDETGVQIETKSLPPDSYGLSLRTQLQGGNAPDLMVVSPGGGAGQRGAPAG